MPKLERWALDTEEQLEKAGGGRRRQKEAEGGRRKEEKGGERRKNKKEEQEGRSRKTRKKVAGQGRSRRTTRIGQFKGRKERFKGKKYKIQRRSKVSAQEHHAQQRGSHHHRCLPNKRIQRVENVLQSIGWAVLFATESVQQHPQHTRLHRTLGKHGTRCWAGWAG